MAPRPDLSRPPPAGPPAGNHAHSTPPRRGGPGAGATCSRERPAPASPERITEGELARRLGGLWPPAGGEALAEVGALVEIIGRGRTSLALRAVRRRQASGRGTGPSPVAWIDGTGRFCPATAGVDLQALTFVRPTEAWGVGCGRADARAFPDGRTLTDGGTFPDGGDAGRPRAAHPDRSPRARQARRSPLTSALFSADVLLRSRAFALVVLDLPRGSTTLATWFRLARLAARSGSLLYVLTGPEDGPLPPRGDGHAERSVTGSAADLIVAVRLDWPEPDSGRSRRDAPPPDGVRTDGVRTDGVRTDLVRPDLMRPDLMLPDLMLRLLRHRPRPEGGIPREGGRSWEGRWLLLSPD